MKLKVYSLQDKPGKELLKLEEEYLKRLRSGCTVEVYSLYKKKFSQLPKAQRLEAEADSLLAKLEPAERLVILDEQGTLYDSVSFANWLGKEIDSGQRPVFALGGAYGWSESIRSKAHSIISLSQLTFTADMARYILVEQLYRAFTILRGMPYHK